MLVAFKYLERVHLDKNQPQMLFLIDSAPGGFCGSRGCRYISAMFLNVPVCHWASFSPLPLDFFFFSCHVRRVVGLEGNGDLSTASYPGLFLCTKAPSNILSHRSPVVQCTQIPFPLALCAVALLLLGFPPPPPMPYFPG